MSLFTGLCQTIGPTSAFSGFLFPHSIHCCYWHHRVLCISTSVFAEDGRETPLVAGTPRLPVTLFSLSHACLCIAPRHTSTTAPCLTMACRVAFHPQLSYSASSDYRQILLVPPTAPLHLPFAYVLTSTSNPPTETLHASRPLPVFVQLRLRFHFFPSSLPWLNWHRRLFR